MSYWKCIKAEILEDGRIVEMSFKNEHGVSRRTITLDAETWSNIMSFQFLAEQPERRWREMQDRLAREIILDVQNKVTKETLKS